MTEPDASLLTLDALRGLALLLGYGWEQVDYVDGTIEQRLIRPDGTIAVIARKRPETKAHNE